MTTTAETHARRDSGGLYRWGGVLLPSVTTCLGMIAKEELIAWNGKQAALEAAREIELYQGGHRTLEEAHNNILNWQHVMTAGFRVRDHAGAEGSLMHHCFYEKMLGLEIPKDLVPWCQMHAHRLELATDEEYGLQLAQDAVPYCQAMLRWVDYACPDLDMIGMEAMVVNLTHGYAGSMDGKGQSKAWAGKRVLDLKKSRGLWWTFPMQCEGYRNGEFIGIPATGEEHEVGDTEGSVILWVRPDQPVESYAQTYDANDNVFEDFLCSVQLWYSSQNKVKPNARIRAKKPGADHKESRCRF
jgi:hypothetical protein